MRVAPPASPLLALALPAQAPGALAAPDTVQFRQALEPTPAGRVSIPIDRNRIATVVVDENTGAEHVPSITLAHDQQPRFVLRCVDLAPARSVFDAFRAEGPPLLEVTGRCRSRAWSGICCADAAAPRRPLLLCDSRGHIDVSGPDRLGSARRPRRATARRPRGEGRRKATWSRLERPDAGSGPCSRSSWPAASPDPWPPKPELRVAPCNPSLSSG
jgi:hypothetical protein